MSQNRQIVPPPGNPMHALFIMVAVMFPAIMIGFALYVVASGAPLGSAVGILYLLGLVTVFSIGTIAWSGRRIERERSRLSSPNVVAAWRLTKDEYRRFVRAEWRYQAAWLAGAFAFGVGIPLLLSLEARDPLFTALNVGIGLAIFVMIILAEMPPLRTNARTRDVRIGTEGIEVMGSYHQIGGSSRSMLSIRLLPGEPSTLEFRVRAPSQRYPAQGKDRVQRVRVPVPHDSLDEVDAIIERFFPPAPEDMSYPAILRRERAKRAAD